MSPSTVARPVVRRRRQARLPRRASRAPLVLALAGALLAAGCAEPDYCETVGESQEAITEAVADGGPGALIGVLPELEALQASAPDDVADEWQQVVGRLEALRDALETADVAPEDYDPDEPPDDLSDDDRARITAAADDLASPATVQALASVEQQVRDVCQTPLYL